MATVEEMTEQARQAVRHARMAAGEPWQDDSSRDIYWLAKEAQAILVRSQRRIATEQKHRAWKRKYWLTWRWRTYRA